MDNYVWWEGELRRDSPVPLYIQLKRIIKEKIEDGVLKPGTLLLSEKELCRIYNISHITVRQALVELTKEGFLFRIPARGTFVKGISPRRKLPVGAVIAETEGNHSSPYISQLLLGIKSVTIQHNLPLLLYTENESEYLAEASRDKLNGLILTDPQVKDTRISILKRKSIPFVVIGRATEEGVYTVDNDNEEIGYLLTAHFLKLGHRRVGFINGPAHFTVSEDRLRGYEKALKEQGISRDGNLIRYGPFSEENGYEKAKELLKEGVSAIVCGDDFIALGALKAIKEEGLRVPEDIALAGCNNFPLTQHTHPPLTSVEIFPYELGKRAGEKLVKLMKGEEVELRSLVKGELVIRESSGSQRGDDRAGAPGHRAIVERHRERR